MTKQEISSMIVARGVVLIISGLIVWLWARGHSPHMELSEMLIDPNNWIFSKPYYIAVIVIAVLLALSGAIQLYRGLRLETNTDSGTGDNANIFCSECGTQCPANTAFCGKCGSRIGGA